MKALSFALGKRSLLHLMTLDSDTGEMKILSCRWCGGRLKPLGPVQEAAGPPERGELYVCIVSRQVGILQATFPKVKREVMRLQMEERLRQEAFLGQQVDFSYRYLRAGAAGDGVTLNLVAVESAPVARVLSWATDRPGLRLRRVAPEMVALAGLMAQLSRKPVLLVVIRGEWMEVAAVEGGAPVFRQAIPLPPGALEEGVMAWDDVERSFTLALHSVLRRRPDEVEGFVVLGGEGLELPEELSGVKRWVPPLEGVVAAENPHSYLELCHLLGVPFVRKELNFVPSSFGMAYAYRRACNVAASVLLAGAMGLGGWSYRLASVDSSLERQYRRLKGEVAAQVSRLSARLPEEGEQALLRRLVSIYQQERRSPRPSHTLIKIASLLPEEVHISRIVVVRERGGGSGQKSASPTQPAVGVGPPPGAAGAPGAAAQHVPAAKGLDLTLTFVSQGDFFSVKHRFEGLSQALGQRFQVKSMDWSYDREGKRGELECSLEVSSSMER